MSHLYTSAIMLVIMGYFIEPGAMQIEVHPGDTVLALNQMSNATFYCSCPDCTSPPSWSLQNEAGRHFNTDNDDDQVILAQRGIMYNSRHTSAVISIPDTAENNNTKILCAAFINAGVEFSDLTPILTIIGLPLPPDPILMINSLAQLDIQWEIPYSHTDYPVVSYNVQIVNMSSATGDVLEGVPEYNETSFAYTFEEDVQYCQILTVNVTAVSDLGPSVPGSISRGFPIAPHQFELDVDDVKVTFLSNGTPMASISFEAPLICDYQTANYTLTIEDITDPRVNLAPIESTYNGSSRHIMVVVALTIDHNYTLFVSVVENHFEIEVSRSIDFTTTFRPGASKGMSSDHLPDYLGIYIGVPIAILLFLLLVAIIIVVILVCSIVRKKKEWRIARGGGDVQASSPASVYETINDYQTHPEVKPHIHLSPQQQEFLWKVQHRQHGEAIRPRDDNSTYQEMMSSRAATEGIRVTPGGFTYPPFANTANQQNTASRPGNAYAQQPCPAAAGSSASPVLGHAVAVTGQLSPVMVMLQDGGGVFLEDDDQEYTAMSQAGTLTNQQSSRIVTVPQQQGQSTSGADGNAALPMYSVVNKDEQSKSQKFMATEC